MLSRRIQNLKPSPTLALAAKAKELVAQGHDVISLSVGEPDWDTFDVVKEAAISAIKSGATKYTPSNGIPELRNAIAKQTNSDLGMNYKPEQVTVSAGGKFVIFSAFQATLDPGDEVIVPAPYWVSYPTMAELAEGRAMIPVCGRESRFKLTPAHLKKAINERTKMLVLNSPSNPTGEVYTSAELKGLADVLREHPRVMVMSDDIYNRLSFDHEIAPHILQVAPDLADRTILINGASKTYSMTGWRVGWALGPKTVIDGMTNYQSQSVSCAAGFSQVATVAAIETARESLQKILPILRKRRDFVCARLSQLPGVDVVVPGGAFYVWPGISAHLGKKWRGQVLANSKDFAQALLEDQRVAAVPGMEFGLDGYLRISFALNEERMGQAVDRMAKFIAGLD